MTLPPHLQGLSESAGKDLDQEAELARLNDLLAPAEAELSSGLIEPKQPVVFVLGPPRSGTTLTSQILAVTGAFGFTSNAVARFWCAPAIGLRIEQALGRANALFSFESARGQTKAQHEPHEFGYFWSRWFDLGQETHRLSEDLLAKVDAAGLKRSLAAIEAAAGKPMMFKNNTWFTFQADWLARTFPTAVIVACARDPYFVAQSIYEQRQALGDAGRWWSVRPAAYTSLLALPPLEQVAAQAVEIEKDMEKALKNIPPNRLVRADYARLCADPRGLVRYIFEACGMNFNPAAEGLKIPENFSSTNRMRLSPQDAERLRGLVSERLAKG